MRRTHRRPPLVVLLAEGSGEQTWTRKMRAGRRAALHGTPPQVLGDVRRLAVDFLTARDQPAAKGPVAQRC